MYFYNFYYDYGINRMWQQQNSEDVGQVIGLLKDLGIAGATTSPSH